VPTTWTDPASFTAGQICRASDLNTISSGLKFVAKRPITLLRQASGATTTTIADSTPVAIPFATEVVDRGDVDGTGMHDTSTNTTQIKPIVAGWYLVSGCVVFDAGSGGTNYYGFREARIYKNGSIAYNAATARTSATTYYYGSPVAAAAKSVVVTVGPMLVSMNGSTDYIELYAYQDSGYTLSTTSAASLGSWFQAVWVSPL